MRHVALLAVIVIGVGGVYLLVHGVSLPRLVWEEEPRTARLTEDRGTSRPSAQRRERAERYVQVTAPAGVVLREDPSHDSTRLVLLKCESVAILEDDSRKGWTKLRTASGHTGWADSQGLREIGQDQAKRARHRDRSNFEARICRLVKQAAREKAPSVHRHADVIDVRVITQLKPHTNTTYEISACTLMKGNIIGYKKFRTEYAIALNMFLDENLLNASEVRVKTVNVVDDRRVDGGLTERDVLNVLGPVLRFFLFR